MFIAYWGKARWPIPIIKSWLGNKIRIATHIGYQLSFARLFGHQPDRPARLPFRGTTADHDDDALLLGVGKNLLRPVPLFRVKGLF